MEYMVITPRGTYRIGLDANDAGDLIALLDYYVDKGAISGPDRLRALSRQQVLAQLGRPTLPEDRDNPFPDPPVVIGEEGTGSFTRGWLDWQVSAWQDAKMQAKLGEQARADETEMPVSSEPDDGVEAPEPTGASEAAQRPSEPATAAAAAATPPWPKGSRQWEALGAADERVAIVTSKGIATPSGWVLTGPLPSPANVPRFVSWHWRKKPTNLPQMWFTAEAMESIGMPVEDADPDEVAEIVAKTFGCKVSWHQSGFFTCRFGVSTSDGDEDGAAPSVANRSAQLVFIPWLPLDPADARPNDLGVAGTMGTDTELPEDEDQAVPILAERIAWIASLGEGVAPASRWSTVGAAFADVRRRASTIKTVKGCPLPAEVLAAQSDIDPDMHDAKRPHKARGEFIKVETDQRAAYLGSAGKLDFGYGEPTRVDLPDPDVLGTQEVPFALWRVTTPPGKNIDGLDQRLQLPNGFMSWDEERTFWTTTRGAQHLISPVDNGGAGLSPAELAIDAAWVWPHQTRLLRGWTDQIRNRLNEAIAEGRADRKDMLQAMYKAYLGRMRSPKWSPQQYHHHQPVWFASIQADTRFRAMTFARHIADTHGLYPVAVDVDAWIYWLPPDADPKVLEEASESNGKYRIKSIEYPPATPKDGKV